jgi:hypothetical protein
MSSQKQIYLLQVADGPALVVRAACETCARSVAVAEAGVEGTAVWRDPERSTCKLVKLEGISGVVLRSDTYDR